MAQLAIKGHSTRGNEVIEILEMLGGRNVGYSGLGFQYYYYIDECDNIIGTTELPNSKTFIIYTLEEFLEKFPYKVGDKVIIKVKNQEAIVDKVVWCCITITYWLQYGGTIEGNWRVEHLQPYKEETMEVTEEFYNKYCVKCGSQRCTQNDEWLEECEHYKKDLDWHPTDYLEFENNDDTWADEVEVNLGNNYEIQVRDSKTFIVRKKPQYPKTYEECHKLMVQWKEYDCNPNSELILCDAPIHDFCKLIVARNIYWKIAGEQMGLGEPWKPNWKDDSDKYFICYIKDELWVSNIRDCNRLLVFPIEEMRDAFCENFKDLIEKCKELL